MTQYLPEPLSSPTSCSRQATWRGLPSGVRSWRDQGAQTGPSGRGAHQLTAANAPELAWRPSPQPGVVPLTVDPSHADIQGMPDPSKGHERSANEGTNQLVARAIERWENEGGAVKPPSKLERPRDPNELGKLSVDMATEEASPDP